MGIRDRAWPLAFLSRLILLLMGLLRLGFLANFLSHPVISGFISASGLLIAASQLKTLLGVSAQGGNVLSLIASLLAQVPKTHGLTLAVGAGSLAFLFWVRRGLKPLLLRMGLRARAADLLAKAGPIAAIAVTTAPVSYTPPTPPTTFPVDLPD